MHAMTEQQRIEAALRKSQERYSSFVSQSHEAIYCTEFDHPIDTSLPIEQQIDAIYQYAYMGECNQAMTTMYGIPSIEALVGQRLIDFHGGKDNPVNRATFRQFIESNYRTVDLETEEVTPTGEKRFFLSNDIGIVEHGYLLRIWGTALDITERKCAEAEQQYLRDQLAQAQKMESVGRLAGGVAHDFNNMLGVILGYVELALDQLDPLHPLHADLEIIQRTAERSAALTRQLLAFARKQPVSPKVLDLNTAVEEMLKMLRRVIGEAITLDWQPGDELWSIRIDPAQLDQILANLCVNARDAIAGAGTVTITTGRAVFNTEYCVDHMGFIPGDFVLLAVSDDGCGMNREEQAHLFEPFYTTKEVGRGTGLGLATIYGVVKQNNGFIHVYTEPCKGSTFTIYLPRYDGDVVPAPSEHPHEIARRGQETVLLVEDEITLLHMSQLMLERLGYRVLIASTPNAAIQLVKEHVGGIDLLMTDVIMPEMNGRELANRVQSAYPHIKKLFISGNAADLIVHHAMMEAHECFIQKPFSMRDLAAKIRAVLKAEPSDQPVPLSAP